MLLYYITDRAQFSGTEAQRTEKLLERIAAAARAGVDFIQLREKDLSTRELELLARKVVEVVRVASDQTRLLINSRTDVALAVGADGVHLRSQDISPADVRGIWRSVEVPRQPIIGVSCHSHEDIARGVEFGADFVAFGPVVEKSNAPVAGLEKLRSASRCEIPVFALGGVNIANAASCIEAGARGIAGIRLFQQADVQETVSKLHSLPK